MLVECGSDVKFLRRLTLAPVQDFFYYFGPNPSEGPWHLQRFQTASLRKMKLGSVLLEAVLVLHRSKLIS